MNQIEQVAPEVDLSQENLDSVVRSLRNHADERQAKGWMLSAQNLRGAALYIEELANQRAAIAAMTVQAEPVAWKNYAEDGDWWLTDDREPADSCERSVPLYAIPTTPPNGGSDAA